MNRRTFIKAACAAPIFGAMIHAWLQAHRKPEGKWVEAAINDDTVCELRDGLCFVHNPHDRIPLRVWDGAYERWRVMPGECLIFRTDAPVSVAWESPAQFYQETI